MLLKGHVKWKCKTFKTSENYQKLEEEVFGYNVNWRDMHVNMYVMKNGNKIALKVKFYDKLKIELPF